MSWSHPTAEAPARGRFARVASTISRIVAGYGGAILGLCVIALLWAGTLHHLSDERGQLERAAIQNTANLAGAFEEHIVRSIRAVDQTLLYVRDSFARDPQHFDLSLWSQNSQFPTDFTFQVAIIDKEGFLLATNLGPVKDRVDLRDREHFRVHADSTRDELFISKPILGRASGKWSIQLTRRINALDGSFNGVAVVSLDPAYLSRFYDSVDVGANGVVTLLGTDGIVRARAGSGNTSIGQSAAGSILFQLYAKSKAANFTEESPIDGIRRFLTYRGVNDYPLIVVVGVAEAEVLVSHAQNRNSYFVAATLLSVLLLAISTLLVLQQVRSQRVRRDLRASEAQFAHKSQQLSVTLEHMSQGIIMVDANRRVRVWNRRLTELLELPEHLLVGEPAFDDILRWQWEAGEFGKDFGDAETWLRNFILSGGITDEPHRYERRRPNGTVLEVRSIPLPGGGIVRTYSDVTLRKQSEEALRSARDEADRAARAKSDFVAMMSHEIRSPMSGLLGIVELLREANLEPEHARMIELAHGSATSLLGVLNDVLDFSKIEAGAIPVVPEPVELRSLIKAIIDPLVPSAATKGIALASSVAEDVPDCISVDALRLRQILVNLLSNAIKFTPAGSIDVIVSRAALGSSDAALCFSVTDTGIGMEADVIARLFEPFTQADASTTRNFGGTGLGLSISRRLAHLLGGDLGVISRPGEGSTFTLTLPAVVAAMPFEPAQAPGAVADPVAVGSLRVLVVEDSPTNRWLAQRQLERLGLSVDGVEDGYGALDKVATCHYDLVLTDCHMPGMDGTILASHIRMAEATRSDRRTPIVGLTADITDTMRQRCLAAGMDGVEIKPINLKRLEFVLRQLFQRQFNVPAPAQAEAAVDAPVFDRSPYRELFDLGDAEGVSWLKGYLQSAAAALERVQESVSAGNRKALSESAHRLAGSSLCVGARRLGEMCRRLEALSGLGEPEPLRNLAQEVTVEFDAMRDEIARFISEVAEAAA